MKTFSTSSFHLAAALQSHDFKCVGIDKSDPYSAKVLFESNEAFEEALRKYWDGSLFVQALRYAQEYKSICDRVKES